MHSVVAIYLHFNLASLGRFAIVLQPLALTPQSVIDRINPSKMIYKIHLLMDEVLVQFFMPRAGHFVFGGTNRSSSVPGASRRTNEPSASKSPSSEPSARTSKQPCERGACCDQGRCSAWATTVYARGYVGRAGERGKPWARRKEKQWMHCEAEDRRVFGITGTGAPPHLSLGFVTAKYSKGVWHRRVGEERGKDV